MSAFDPYPPSNTPITYFIEDGTPDPIQTLDTTEQTLPIVMENFFGSMAIFKRINQTDPRAYAFHIGLNLSKNIASNGLNRSVSGHIFSYDPILTVTTSGGHPDHLSPFVVRIEFPDTDILEVLFYYDHKIGVRSGSATNNIQMLTISFSGYQVIPCTFGRDF